MTEQDIANLKDDLTQVKVQYRAALSAYDRAEARVTLLRAALIKAEAHIDAVCGETLEADLPDWFADLTEIRSVLAQTEPIIVA